MREAIFGEEAGKTKEVRMYEEVWQGSLKVVMVVDEKLLKVKGMLCWMRNLQDVKTDIEVLVLKKCVGMEEETVEVEEVVFKGVKLW